MDGNIRVSAVAGGFYPENKNTLNPMIEDFLEKCTKSSVKGALRGLIVPHAGYIYSGIVAAAGDSLLSSMKKQPEKIILIGPSHYEYFSGLAESNAKGWKTPLGTVETGRISALAKSIGATTRDGAHAPEHCLEVQLPFLQKIMKKNYTVFPVLTGELNYGEVARNLAPVLSEENAFLLISSDLSHYLPYGDARRIDASSSEIIEGNALSSAENIVACGKTGIVIAMHVAKLLGWNCRKIDYKNSGDTAGDKSRVVGYGCYAFEEK